MACFSALTALFVLIHPAWAQTPPPSEVTYTHEQGRAKIVLAPLPLDLVRAFYIGRGFTSEDADLLALEGCVFRLDVGNEAKAPDDGALSIDLAQWRMDTGDGARPVPLKEIWLMRFAERDVPTAAQVAFRWATFPNDQTFRAGDYNWGMLAFTLPPGTRFDLNLWWNDGGSEKTHWLRGLTCASS